MLRRIIAAFVALAVLALPAWAQDGSTTRDADALACQTFYRGVAGPAVAGYSSYVEIYNPPASGVYAIIDAYAVWAGTATSGEYGIIHYNTPFTQAPLVSVAGPLPVVPTHYGCPDGKTVIYVGAYTGPLGSFIDNAWAGPSNTGEQRIKRLPYPIILSPGDGIVFWNPTPGNENKVEIWLREKPLSFTG